MDLHLRVLSFSNNACFIFTFLAFVIKMPIMHRLACLRDDAIFIVYVYQRWKYRTDYSRVNEFGQCENPTDEMIDEIQKEGCKDEREEIGIRGAEKKNATEMVVTNDSSSDASTVRKRRGAREKDFSY